METLLAAYRSSEKRLLLLDYDGTLVGYAPTPDKAQPPTEVIALLKTLVSDPCNTVVIVSGRPPETLDKWLGEAGTDMAAEHGHFIKRFGRWQKTTAEDTRWKLAVKKQMSLAAREVPGSFIEEKHTSLVWHYRQATSTSAEKVAAKLAQALKGMPAVHISRGAKIVEARQPGADKGRVARAWLAQDSYDFILAAGDDTTDEDLFASLSENAFTVKIGTQPTMAQIRIASPRKFVALLQQLTT